MNWLKKRMAEGSSHGGLAALAQVGKVFFPEWAPVLDAATVLCGTLAVALKDKPAS